MRTREADVTVWKVVDHEGDGECQHCGKTGLRWVVYLSDGSRVGGECAKRIVGWAPTRSKFVWLEGLQIVAEGELSPTQHLVLWQSTSGTVGRISMNGHLTTTGPFDYCKREFERLIH